MRNLNFAIHNRKLEEIFSAFGEVTSAKVVRHDNGASRGFGYVKFSNPEDANKALTSLNGKLDTLQFALTSTGAFLNIV